MSIKFIDLNSQQLRLKDEINSGIQSVLKHGQYILGPEVRKFEKNLAKFGKSKYALGCANGTDAIVLPLLAWEIGPGDAVFCPSFTYCATAEAIANTGATPVFIDVHRRTYNIDPESLERAINEVKKNRQLVPRAVIAVDLFGQSANYPILSAIAKSYDLKLIADSAQGFGTTLKGKHPLHWADITTTSFFPAKPLGCYGDGGAILTNDENLAIRIESLRFHGKGVEKYDNTHIGLNSRLDTLQAAILLPKLKIFSEEINVRNFIANRYIDGLKDHVSCLPKIMNGVISTWAQFTIEVTDPELFARRLKEKGIPTARYYPKPVHQQSAYSHFPIEGKKLLNTEDCSNHTISLPMHPYLDNRTQDIIIEIVQKAVK